MTLKEYLEDASLSISQFAEQIGVDDSTVRRYLLGTRRPSNKLIVEIARLTDSKVTANDFLGIAA